MKVKFGLALFVYVQYATACDQGLSAETCNASWKYIMREKMRGVCLLSNKRSEEKLGTSWLTLRPIFYIHSESWVCNWRIVWEKSQPPPRLSKKSTVSQSCVAGWYTIHRPQSSDLLRSVIKLCKLGRFERVMIEVCLWKSADFHKILFHFGEIIRRPAKFSILMLPTV